MNVRPTMKFYEAAYDCYAANEDTADYTVHDAFYDASCKLGCGLPEEETYDEYVDEFRIIYGVDMP